MGNLLQIEAKKKRKTERFSTISRVSNRFISKCDTILCHPDVALFKLYFNVNQLFAGSKAKMISVDLKSEDSLVYYYFDNFDVIFLAMKLKLLKKIQWFFV